MKLWLFWTCWSIDALIGVIVLYFFFTGLADGSVSSFNMGIWTALLAALAVIIGGSLWLKSAGYLVAGILLLMILAIPGILYGLFMLLIIVSNPRWN